MKVFLALALSVLSILPLTAVDLRCDKDIPYQNISGYSQQRQILDVYFNQQDIRNQKPVIIWIHGGGWKFGDKSHKIAPKAETFVKANYIFVAMNYRFHPDVSWGEQVTDVAQATKWVTQNISKYGGNPNCITLMGHSAGAHLAAMTGADSSYLIDAKVNPSVIKSIILLDGAGYDIPQRIKTAKTIEKRLYLSVFSETPSKQAAASTINYFSIKTKAPSYLIISAGDRPMVSKSQSKILAQKINATGGTATTFTAPNRDHSSLNKLLGSKGDAATAKIRQFLDEHLVR